MEARERVARRRPRTTTVLGLLGLVSASVLASVTPGVGAQEVRATRPGVPRAVAVAATGVTSLRVTFTKPTSNGGATITTYTVRCTSVNGGAAKTVSRPGSPIVVSSLTAGARYTCSVRATNRIGAGSWSAGRTVTLAHYRATKIAAGATFSCALATTGTVRCWGSNTYGETGVGAATVRPRLIAGVSGATDIAAGAFHVCALLGNGTVSCWGYNSDGQTGNGTSGGNQATPKIVAGLSGVTAVAAGRYHTCARLSTGTVKCWGDNDSGQIGDGTTLNDRTTPTAVTGLGGTVTSIALGDLHACAQLASGAVQCWGYGLNGQLGNGVYASSSTPVTVTGISSSYGVSAGQYHSCSVIGTTAMSCWGLNTNGQLGNTTLGGSATPTAVNGLPGGTVGMSVAGGYTTCAIIGGTAVRCWGDNGRGQVGDGTTTDRYAAVAIATTARSNDVAVGVQHACALGTDGTVRCWGDGTSGQLGTGRAKAYSASPVRVLGF